MKQRIVCIPDAHLPFLDKRAFSLALDIVKDLKPTIIVNLGDLYDFFSTSRFPRTHDLRRPKDEFIEAREMAIEMWWGLQNFAAKGVKCFQLRGNHDQRPIKRLMEQAPDLLSLFNIDHLWEFKGVTDIKDPRQPLELEGILFMHGYRVGQGAHMRYNLQSTVTGHTHQPGITYMPHRGQVLFELNCGHIADIESEALKYTPTKINKWTKGIGYIDKFGPRFISVES